MNKYVELVLEISPKDPSLEKLKEIAISEFSCNGIEDYSISEKELKDILGSDAYCESNLSKNSIEKIETNIDCKEGKIKFYFSGNNFEGQARTFINFLNSFLIKPSYQINIKDEEDYSESWKKYYQPIEIGRRFKVVPEWLKTIQNSNEIYINPGMAFGTGDHETTYLCLKIWESLLQQQQNISLKTCFDLGCGSGILGIATLKAGIDSCFFCDIDPDALENTQQNLNINEIENDRFTLALRGKLISEVISNSFDIVFANILLNVLNKEKDLILVSLKKGGILIVSGILHEQEHEILETYQCYFKENYQVERKGMWSAILFNNKY